MFGVGRTKGRYLVAAGVAAAVLGGSGSALAALKRAGTWPSDDPKVTLKLDRVPSDEAIRKLADAAGWSVVLRDPPGGSVQLHVKDQPASKVLELILADGSYVATRDGTLVAIGLEQENKGKPSDPPAIVVRVPDLPEIQVPLPPPPPPPPDADDADDADDDDAADAANDDAKEAAKEAKREAKEAAKEAAREAKEAAKEAKREAKEAAKEHEGKGSDRTVAGQGLRIEKGEVVHDVSVLGGSLDVFGTVTGDVDVMGGRVHVHEGGKVKGDISAMGGNIIVDNGAEVDGDMDVAGGRVERGENAVIKGDVRADVRRKDDSPIASRIGSAFSRAALLFLLGAILLATAPQRLDLMKEELAKRPMKSFGWGFLGILAFLGTFLVLCITVIGAPIAFIGSILAVVALGAGVTTILEVVGRALSAHKTPNPYWHLAVGCVVFLAASLVPVVGEILTAAVVVVAVGLLWRTRVGGLLQRKPKSDAPGSGPYRAASTST